MTGNSLALLDQAVRLLAEVASLEEITQLHSMAAAAEKYAKAERLGAEAERYAREIRVRAGRKAGEVLAQMAEQGQRVRGNKHDKGLNVRLLADPVQRDIQGVATLSDLGLTRPQASRWQRLARVPEEDFEAAVKAGKGEVTIANIAPPSKPGTRRRQATSDLTQRQLLLGLQQVAIQIQGLAEAIDGGLLGDWTRLYEKPEADRFFDIITESLPLLVARLKRILEERKSHARRRTG